MTIEQIAAGVFLGNVLSASVILTLIRHWKSQDHEWSYWAYFAIIGPSLFAIAVLIAR